MKEKFFALALNDHRIWGLVLMPMMIGRESGDTYYSPDHSIFPVDTDENFNLLSFTEKEIVKTIDQYSEKNLFKLFSKNKSVKEFQEKLDKEKLKQFIRPFIEKRIHAILQTIRGTNIKIFLREQSRTNIFEEDFLKIMKEDAVPVFNFVKGEDGSRYSMELHYGGKKVIFREKYIDILSDFPAVIRINRKILFVKDIEAKKISPFFLKDFIAIPEQAEIKYFKTFLLNIVKRYEVKTQGFEIKEIVPSPSALISLERGIDNNGVIVLSFIYGKRSFLANTKQEVFADFHHTGDNFYYEKFKRDSAFEDRVHDILTDLGLITYDHANYELKGNRRLDFTEQVYELLEWYNENIDDIVESGFKFQQKTGKENYYIGKKDIIISTDLNIDWFDIRAILKIGDFEIPFTSLRDHILNNNREYTLPDGTIFIIPRAWLVRFKEMFEFGKSDNDKIKVHKQHFFIIEKIELENSGRSFANLDKLNKREDLPVENIPHGITAELRPYQAEGFTWLWYLQQNNLGGCLADDMGLGKTLQAICLLQKNKEDFKPPIQEKIKGKKANHSLPSDNTITSLVVVPASLVHNWINELKRFAPGLKCYAFAGNQRTRQIKDFAEFDVIISTYHTVRQDVDLLSAFPFHTIILDESQVIKNPSSKIYRAVNMLNSNFRLALTGTPIENSLTDLWAQMNFVNNGLLGNLNFFRKEYVVPIEKKSDPSREEKLKKLINPFILRRTKEEVAKDLPEITEQVIYCSMSEEQRRFYEEEKSSIRNSIFDNIEKEGVEHSSMIVLQGLTRLRQISNHPVLVDEHYRDDSGKFSEILRNIENVIAEGHKVLVFSSFVKHLELFEKEMNRSSFEFTKLTGESTNREDIVRKFQENPTCKIFLISLKAGGLGLNLTAADYVFVLDPWWNPASEDQAVNRAHRIGQDKNVFVFRFISENSIEEKIQLLQERKTRLADSFIHSNNPLKEISRKELEELFA